jgi:hypothetical protein
MRVMSNGKVRRSVEDWRAICERFTECGLEQKEFWRRNSPQKSS